MTKMPSHLIENPSFEPYKPKKPYPRRGISLLSIIFSVFTYILIFYVFNVSPSSVFNDTKILFFISNTLILIIAADYGAFTDKENRDLHRDYYANAKARGSPVFVPDQYQENPRSKNQDHEMLAAQVMKNRAEEATTKDIVCAPSTHEEVPEKIVRVVSENVPRNKSSEKPEPSKDQTTAEEKPCDARNSVTNPKRYRRSKSDKTQTKRIREKRYGRSESDSTKWMVVHQKTASEKTVMDQKWENVLEESEEFSKMSNEELNRRVEEFIQRFNRQIKLQALENRQVLS